MSLKAQHIVAAAAAFAASMYGGYQYAKPMKELQESSAMDDSSSSTTTTTTFDRLAPLYDRVIGAEEGYMFMGLLRWWLLRRAQGDVLEISAGTGRNLPHYSYSNIHSLTVTDVSQPMLSVAQAKFFDGLQLQYKQPQLTVKFLLADGEDMLQHGGQAPVLVPLPAAPTAKTAAGLSKNSISSGAGGGGQEQHQESHQGQHQETTTASNIWRFKPRQPVGVNSSEVVDSSSSSTNTITTSSSSSHKHSSSSSSSDTSDATATGLAARAEDCTASSSSSWRWKTRKTAQQQQQLASSPCCCRSSLPPSTSSSSSSLQSSKFLPGSFDTVVDTFGLCSCQDPVQVLRQAAALVRPGGRLLLLEHGRGTWAFVNQMLDSNAERHQKLYGCWYNRDILEIVKQAGLVVESSSRWHFGTTYVIVATPAATAAGAAADSKNPKGSN